MSYGTKVAALLIALLVAGCAQKAPSDAVVAVVAISLGGEIVAGGVEGPFKDVADCRTALEHGAKAAEALPPAVTASIACIPASEFTGVTLGGGK